MPIYNYLSQILDFSDELLEVRAGFQSTHGWTLVNANLCVTDWNACVWKCICWKHQGSGSLHFHSKLRHWRRVLYSYRAGERASVVHLYKKAGVGIVKMWSDPFLPLTRYVTRGKVLCLVDSIFSFLTLGKSQYLIGLLGGLNLTFKSHQAPRTGLGAEAFNILEILPVSW